MDLLTHDITFNRCLFFGAMLLLLAICKISCRKKMETFSDFFLGGRSMGYLTGTATFVATGYSGWTFVGSPGNAYRYGAIELFASGLYTFALCLVIMWIFPLLRRKSEYLNAITIPDYIAKSHASVGTREAKILSFVGSVLGIVLVSMFLIAEIKALGLLTSSWLGVSDTVAVWLCVFFMCIYILLGGFMAIAWVDVALMFFIGTILLYMYVNAWSLFQVDDIVSKLNIQDLTLLSPPGGMPFSSTSWGMIFFLFHMLLYPLTTPSMVTRLFGMHKDVQAHKLAVCILIASMLLIAPFPIFGLLTRAYLLELEDPDQSIFEYIKLFVSPGMVPFVLLCLLFGIQTTMNSMMLTLISLFGYDLQISQKKKMGELAKNQKEVMFKNRLFAIMVMIILCIAYPWTKDTMVVRIAYMASGTMIATWGAPVLMSFISPLGWFSCLSSMVAGFVSSFMLQWMSLDTLGMSEVVMLASGIGFATYFIFSKNYCRTNFGSLLCLGLSLGLCFGM